MGGLLSNCKSLAVLYTYGPWHCLYIDNVFREYSVWIYIYNENAMGTFVGGYGPVRPTLLQMTTVLWRLILPLLLMLLLLPLPLLLLWLLLLLLLIPSTNDYMPVALVSAPALLLPVLMPSLATNSAINGMKTQKNLMPIVSTRTINKIYPRTSNMKRVPLFSLILSQKGLSARCSYSLKSCSTRARPVQSRKGTFVEKKAKETRFQRAWILLSILRAANDIKWWSSRVRKRMWRRARLSFATYVGVGDWFWNRKSTSWLRCRLWRWWREWYSTGAILILHKRWWSRRRHHG